MLSTKPETASPRTRRPGGARQLRTWQRRAHLLAGLAVVVHVYLDPGADSPLGVAVRWVLLPALVASGVAMWQAPRLRRLARGGSRS
jgi:hypothetical protein